MPSKKRKTALHRKSEADCAHKLVFDTEKDAVAVATTLNHQRDSKLSAYHCKGCALWHLTSS